MTTEPTPPTLPLFEESIAHRLNDSFAAITVGQSFQKARPFTVWGGKVALLCSESDLNAIAQLFEAIERGDFAPVDFAPNANDVALPGI